MEDKPFWERSEVVEHVDKKNDERATSDESRASSSAADSRAVKHDVASERHPNNGFSWNRAVVSLLGVSFIAWTLVLVPAQQIIDSSAYADEAKAWPTALVHHETELQIWTEEITCNEEQTGPCYHDYFVWDVVLECSMTVEENYECGPDTTNGTLVTTVVACEPNSGVSSLYESHVGRGPMPNPCGFLDNIGGWGPDGAESFPMQYYDNRYDEYWDVYDSECKWQSEANDEPYWNCYYGDGAYDTWWHHCEFDSQHALWFCIDAFGEAASSESNQNASERPNGSAEALLDSMSSDALEVHYDPEDPSRIFIGDPSVEPSNFSSYALIAVGSLVVCIAVVVFLVRLITSSRR